MTLTSIIGLVAAALTTGAYVPPGLQNNQDPVDERLVDKHVSNAFMRHHLLARLWH